MDKEELELRAKLQQKKSKVRKALKAKGVLPKGSYNAFDRYKYFSEAQYKELFTELFSANGLELRSSENGYSSFEGTEKQANGRTVRMEFELIDTETGYGEISYITGEGIDKGDKAGYKAMTGALKYYLACNFMVATGDDPEVDSPDVKMNSKAKITAAQKNVIVKKYQGDALTRLLEWAGVTSLDDMTIDQATRVIKQIKEKEERK